MTTPSVPRPLSSAVDAYRATRRHLESSVGSLASSLDGRRFELQASLHDLAFQLGGYVRFEDASGARLGQIVELRHGWSDGPSIGLPVEAASGDMDVRAKMQLRHAIGDGVVLDGDGKSFHEAAVRPARPEELAAWLDRTRSHAVRLPVGTMTFSAEIPLALDAGGFNRHTFFCGQSGSGKTYALGTVLERLLLDTDLRIVVLDPNSDSVRMSEVRADAEASLARRYAEAAAGISVLRASGRGPDPLHVRAANLSREAQAAILRLDPLRDREEYARLMLGLEEEQPTTLEVLAVDQRPGSRELADRVRNLGIDRWNIWSRGGADTLAAALDPSGPRFLVVDLGSLASPEERLVISETVLSTLWNRREERSPVLIVIDEAHNVCPAAPGNGLEQLSTDHVVRIAGEGRKFGIYLLLATQRPRKIHEDITSQCDNLVLMRTNSRADIERLQELFSFVPPALLERAETFGQGETLIGGKIVTHPSFGRIGPRWSLEGGADVPSTWTRAR